MIVDSHAHYAHACYCGSFRYLAEDGDWCIHEGTRETLLEAFREQGIAMSVEPGISLASNGAILALAQEYPDRIFPAVGVHPTRCFKEKWRDRRELLALSKQPGVVAIGETGLDYHHPRREQHRMVQTAWFLWQMRLAQKRCLPVVLHIRDADRDAIRILRLFCKRWRGGVVHCFGGDWETARQYIDMGCCIGIGGMLLQPEERSGRLRQAVAQMPLDRILVETDSPYVLPYCKDVLAPREVRRLKNSSLTLPRVIEEIARIKGLSREEVERVTAENAIRLFSLPGHQKLE